VAETLPTHPRVRPGEIVHPPKAPRHLSAGSRRLWGEVVTGWRLDPPGWRLLQSGLESLDLYEAMRKQVVRDGAVVVSPRSGVSHKNPAVAVMNDAFHAYRAAFRQLNLAPPRGGKK
jgi:phage terminase small subunit